MSSYNQCVVVIVSCIFITCRIIAFLLVCYVGVQYVEGVSCNWDIPSRAAVAPLVLEGRTRRTEAIPSLFARTSSGSRAELDDVDFFNVTVKARTVLKGVLPKDSRDGYLPIVVGVFTTEEDRVNCIPSVNLGSRYIMFLNNTGIPSSFNRAMNFYKVVAFPVPSTNETLNLVKQYSCKNCAHAPSIALFPKAVELQLTLSRKLHLRCSTSGRPTPSVVWTKNDVEIVANRHVRITNYTHRTGSHLRIAEVTSDDGGRYKCQAINVLGQATSNTTTVVIQTSFPEKAHAHYCTAQNYCLNGGVCYILPAIGRKFCECRENFGGIRCQDRLSSPFIFDFSKIFQGSFESTLIPVFLVAVFFILVLLCLMLCCLFIQGNRFLKILRAQTRRQLPVVDEGPLLIADERVVEPELPQPAVVREIVPIIPRRLEIAVQTDSPVEPSVPVGIMQQLSRLGEGRVHANGVCNIALLQHDYPLAFNDESAPPLPVKHSTAGQCNLRSAAQNNFRLRKGGISEDREDAECKRRTEDGKQTAPVSKCSAGSVVNCNVWPRMSSCVPEVKPNGVCSYRNGIVAVDKFGPGNKNAPSSRPMSEVYHGSAAKMLNDNNQMAESSQGINSTCSPMSESDARDQLFRFAERGALRKANKMIDLCPKQQTNGYMELKPMPVREVCVDVDPGAFLSEHSEILVAPMKARPKSSSANVNGNGRCSSPGGNCYLESFNGNSNNNNSKDLYAGADIEHNSCKGLPNGCTIDLGSRGKILKPFGEIRFPHSDADFNSHQLTSDSGSNHSSRKISVRANGLLPDRRSSDYEFSANLAASDLEVNMESEVDIQGLNASEEDVCGENSVHRKKKCRRGRDESSFDSYESETSESSIDHGSSYNRKKKLLGGKNLGDDDQQQTNADWDQMVVHGIPLSRNGELAPTETFSLNRVESLYAERWVRRPKASDVSGANNNNAVVANSNLYNCVVDHAAKTGEPPQTSRKFDPFLDDMDSADPTTAERLATDAFNILLVDSPVDYDDVDGCSFYEKAKEAGCNYDFASNNTATDATSSAVGSPEVNNSCASAIDDQSISSVVICAEKGVESVRADKRACLPEWADVAAETYVNKPDLIKSNLNDSDDSLSNQAESLSPLQPHYSRSDDISTAEKPPIDVSSRLPENSATNSERYDAKSGVVGSSEGNDSCVSSVIVCADKGVESAHAHIHAVPPEQASDVETNMIKPEGMDNQLCSSEVCPAITTSQLKTTETSNALPVVNSADSLPACLCGEFHVNSLACVDHAANFSMNNCQNDGEFGVSSNAAAAVDTAVMGSCVVNGCSSTADVASVPSVNHCSENGVGDCIVGR